LLLGLIIPKKYTISEKITINKPQAEVYEYIKLLKNQELYSVWILDDTTNTIRYIGVDGTIGAQAVWVSEKSGKGSQTISKLDGERVDVDLKFIEPYESNQKASTIAKKISVTQSEVISEFYDTEVYPMNVVSFISKIIIRDAEKRNFINLKNILEK